MQNDKIEIDAFPSKEFFIDMATKDISISEAILELVDNSIDAAKKDMSNNPEKTLNDYFADIIIRRDNNIIQQLVVEDNCGGMDINTAKNAFKSGHVKGDYEIVENSIGVFGIGMKRSIYKLGKKTNIYSKTNTDGNFHILIDADDWKSEEKKHEWKFHLEKKEDDILKQDGFKIEIVSFNEEVSSYFSLDSEIFKLGEFLRTSLAFFINSGFVIKLNGVPLVANNQYVLDNAIVKPALYKYESENISFKIIAGLTEKGEPEKAGWYVYCNGRALLIADKTGLTGWRDASSQTSEGTFDESDTELVFSPAYEMFRGYICFEAKNPKFLPVNTTKIGVDTNSSEYVRAKTQMKNMTEEVTKMFKSLDKQAKRTIEAYSIKKNAIEFFKITNESIPELFDKISICRPFEIDISALLSQNSAVEDDSTVSFNYSKKALKPLRDYFDTDSDAELMKKLLSIAEKDYLED